MRLAARLNILIATPLIMGGMACALVAFHHMRQRDFSTCSRVAWNVELGARDITRVTYEYLLAPGPETETAWKNVSTEAAAQLETSPTLPEAAEAILDECIALHRELPDLFATLVTATTGAPVLEPSAGADARNAMLAALAKISQAGLKLTDDERVTAAGLPAPVVGGLASLLSLLLMGAAWVTLRPVISGVQALRQGLAPWLIKESQVVATAGQPVGELAELNAGLDLAVRELKAVRDELGAETRLREDAAVALRGANIQLSETMSRLKRAQSSIVQQERVQALRQVARGVVHDVNDALMPLVGISDYYQLYPDQLADRKEVADSFRRIQEAADRAARVIRNLATFCSPMSMGFLGRVNLGRVVEEVVAATATMRKGKGQPGSKPVEIRTELGDVPDFQGDVPDLADALTAIVINAIEAMPDGGTLVIRTTSDGATATLDVVDSGPGMLPEVAERCLEPFFSTRGKGHSGMGLTAAHGAVTRAGGTLQVSSAQGKGTTITIRLPIKKMPDRPSAGADSNLPGRHLKILLVDDQPWSSHVVERHLKTDGHTVTTTASGRDGLELALRQDFDLVLLDRVMPDMGGDEVAAALQAAKPKLPIVMVTGFGVMMSDQGDVPAGVTTILSKPVKQVDLRRVLTQVAG